MDKVKLIEAFKATLIPEQRQQAEVFLNEGKKIITFVPQIFSIVLQEDVDPAARQSAAIFAKNTIEKHWTSSEEQPTSATEPLPFVIHESDKQVVRDNIVQAVVTLPESLRYQLAVSVGTIIKSDFPGKWPDFVDKVMGYLTSGDPKTYQGAFTCVHKLVKAYEYKKTKDKEPVLQAMRHFLPVMRQRCTELMEDQSKEMMMVKKTIIKTFVALVHFSFPMTLVDEGVFLEWMQVSKQLLEAPEPPECAQLEDDERTASVWWKVKKWAMYLLSRVFERFGSPGNVLKEYKAFSEFFLKTYAVGLQESVMMLLSRRLHGHFISHRVSQLAFLFLNTGVAHSLTWKALKPHTEVLIRQIIYPMLGHTESDHEMWRDDPVEYIKIKYEMFDEMGFHPTSNAQSLLVAMVKRRVEIFQQTLSFCMSELMCEEAEKKDRALHMIGCLIESLRKKPYKDQVEGLLMSQVAPLLTSPVPFLRARACWMLHRFSDIKFKNPQNAIALSELLLKLLHEDRDLPVKVEAVLALHDLQVEQPKVQEFLIPHIEQIFTDMLQLIRSAEAENVNMCLQNLVYSFEEQVKPIALQMTTHLAETATGLLGTCNDPMDDHSGHVMSVLNTLETFCQVLEEHKETLESIEAVVIEVIKAILVANNADYFESMFSLMQSLTSSHVTAHMWEALPVIYQLFKKEDNTEFFVDMMPVLHNYISVDPSACIQQPSRIETLFNMAQDVLTNEDVGEDCECHAAKLLEIMLLQYKQEAALVCKMTPLFINLVLTRLSRPIKDHELKTMCLQVVLASLFVNSSLTLAVLAQVPVNNEQPGGMVRKVVEEVLKEHASFYGIHDRKMLIIGLSTLISLSGDLRPAHLYDLAPSLVPSIIAVFKKIKKAYECQNSELDSDDEDKKDEEEEDEEEKNHDDDEDVIDDEHEEYMQSLEKFENGDDDDDDDDDDDLEDETLLESFETVLDKEDCEVEEYQLFRAVVEGVRSVDAQWYEVLMSNLNEENQKELVEIFNLAEKKRSFRESKRLEQEGGYKFTNMNVPQDFCFNSRPSS